MESTRISTVAEESNDMPTSILMDRPGGYQMPVGHSRLA
jgi:hypothetical protein